MGVKERAGLSGGSEDGDEMKARVLMFQGTGSDVGKSVTVADLVILPGSKSTIADLRFLRGTGWDVDLRAHLRRGGHIVGI